MLKKFQKWDDIHCGIMKGTKFHADDVNSMEDI